MQACQKNNQDLIVRKSQNISFLQYRDFSSQDSLPSQKFIKLA